MSTPTVTSPARGGSRPAKPSASGSPLAGTGTLIRFILRRDRIRVPVWVLAIAGTVLSSAASFPDLFPTDEDVALRITLIQGNPAGVALTGPGYGVETATTDNLGPMVANELSAMTLILFALMSILLMGRHTRAEEESGRADLVRAGVVGRHAPLTAALAVVGATNLVLGVLLALGLAGTGLPVAGSVAFGASMAGVGLLFAAVAALGAQITESARAAGGMAGAVLGAAYGLRAIGDATAPEDADTGVLSWFSPLGWAQGVRPYADERWWPLLLVVGLAVAFAAAAYLLNGRRDVGAGLIRPRPGRATASPALAGPFGLAFRLQLGGLLGWGAGLFIGGLAGGAIAGEGETLSELDIYEQFMGQGEAGLTTDTIIGFYLAFLGLSAGGYALQTVLRARAEETSGRVEPLLATAVARWRWAGSHLATALLGTAIVLGAGGLGFGLVHATNVDDVGEVTRLLAASLVYLPALALLIGLAVALFGLAPRAVGAVWVVLAYAVFLRMFGQLLQLPDWMFDISPFEHLPQVPAEEFTATPLLITGAIALALMAVGLVAFQRRDLRPG